MVPSNLRVKIIGHVKISEDYPSNVVFEKRNAIHGKNMSLAIARGLSRGTNQFIHSMRFGNGGTIPTTGTDVSFRSPNVLNPNATLYNQTYQETFEPGNVNGNYLTFQEDADLYPIIVCQVTISSNQPSSQLGSSELLINNPNNEFAFDELGLFSQDGKMLSHVIFPPRLKVQGKDLIFTYTLTIIASDEVEV